MIASTVRTAYQGSAPTKMRLAGNEYDIRVILKEEDRKNVEDLKYLCSSPLPGAWFPGRHRYSGDHRTNTQLTEAPNQICDGEC